MDFRFLRLEREEPFPSWRLTQVAFGESYL